jgi:hypothetical protein
MHSSLASTGKWEQEERVTNRRVATRTEVVDSGTIQNDGCTGNWLATVVGSVGGQNPLITRLPMSSSIDTISSFSPDCTWLL